MPTGILSRRDFLKLSGAALLGTLLSELHLEFAQATSPFKGRVQATKLNVRDAPSFKATKVDSLKQDTFVEISEQIFAGDAGDYNRIWYRLKDGRYVYSGWVQKVETIQNPVVKDIPEAGRLGEITIPIAYSVYQLNKNPSPGPYLYYATTHWITALVIDQRDGSSWYKAYDAALDHYYYIGAEGVHLFSPEELVPLSPQVPAEAKHIEIELNRQLLLAYEWNTLVYAARVATGVRNYESPTGWFRTFHKRPTYHMFGGADENSAFDLPGVPWDSYISEKGVAIHGTYWHNDFGHSHSHGCINMSTEDAKWVFRWTLPSVPPGERLVLQPGMGTRVLIVRC